MIAAASARLSAATSVPPSGLTARSRGQDRVAAPGGNVWYGGVPTGGGTGITPSRCAIPLLGSYLKTWITSPCWPGTLGGVC